MQPFNQFGPLNALAYIGQQGEIGRERGRQNQLAQLASQSYGASSPAQQQSLLTSMAVIDPASAQSQQKAFASDEDRRNKTLSNMANLLVNAPEQARAGLYAQMVPTLSGFGLSDLPQQYDAQTAPIIDQAARAIYTAYSGAAGQTPTDVRSFQMMTAGLSPEDRERARRINLGLTGRESSAAISYQKVKGPDGIDRLVAVDPRQIGAQVVGDGTGYGSFSQQAPAAGGGDHFGSFSQLAAEFPAATMTSGARSAERNAQVGGQPNSQHLNGTAADYAVPANQKPAFISRVRQLGYQAIDEGDHIHVQVPRTASGQGGSNLFAGRRPEDEAAAVEAAKLGVQQEFLRDELNMRNDADIDRTRRELQVKTEAERDNKQVDRTRDANETLSLLQDAESYLTGGATGGLLAAGGDRAAAVFNRSTEGAEATAALRVISGQLVGKVPRFEGPQSDKDVKLYKEMAGDLANDTLPVSTRLSALRQMRALQQKSASQTAGGQGAGTQRTITRSGTLNGRRVVQYSDGSIEYGN